MSDRDNKVIEMINHYQSALNRYVSRGEEHKILHCLDKLRRLPIAVSHLEETGVGRTVNSLRKVDGDVGEGARQLVNQWKEMVEQDTHDNDEQDSDKEEMEECTENEESSSQNDIETSNTSNLSSSDDKKSSSSSKINGENSSKSNRHAKDKEKYDKKHNESSSSKKHENSSSSKGSSKSSYKRKHEESSLKVEDENSDNSEDSDDRKNRKLKKCRGSSPKTKNSGESENKHNKDKNSMKKTERYKDKNKESKDKKDRSSRDKHEKEFVIESPKVKLENEHSHKKESSKDKDAEKDKSYKKESTSSKKSSSNKEKKRKDERQTEPISNSSESTKKDKHSSSYSKSSRKSTSSSNSNKIKDKIKLADSIDSGSGASFAEALGMLEPPPTIKSAKKKSVNNTKSDSKNISLNLMASSSSSKLHLSPQTSKEKEVFKEDPSFLSPMKNVITDNFEDDDYLSDENDFNDKIDFNGVPDLLSNPPKLDPLEINISSLLPAITPNYRPVANNPLLNENPRHKALAEYERLSDVITSKNARTKVYSGNKMAFGKIPSLFELCTRILMDNIDALEYTGGVPYMILKPVLEKCTPDQLLILEHFNPYLIEDTDGLWKFHSQREFRTKKREEWESWREMYIRCVDEREAKLRALTANIKQSQDKSLPVRQTKLAYVDSVVKPPRSIARKQQKNGYTPDAKSPLITPSSRLSAIAQSGSAGQVCVPNPGPRASVERTHSNALIKIKKAPLMQKTLQLMKGRFRR